MFIVYGVRRCSFFRASLKTHSSETPMKGLFKIFFFSLSSYHRACGARGNIRAVFPVVSWSGVCQTCNPQACVCTSHQKEHSVMNPRTTSAFKPFMCSSLPVTWPDSKVFKGCLSRHVDSFGFRCSTLFRDCLKSTLRKVNVIALQFRRW